MALTLVVVTQDNAKWAITENFRRIYEEMKYKVPTVGRVTLEGDWDFQSLYNIIGANDKGPNSAANAGAEATRE